MQGRSRGPMLGDRRKRMVDVARTVFRHHDLLFQLVWREIVGMYRGSIMGMLWIVISPIILLMVYGFVFSTVMQVRWPITHDAEGLGFAPILFSGLIVHGFVSEVVNTTPRVITNSPNFVQKVVFPLEILPLVRVCVALFHLGIGFLILLAFLMLTGFAIHWTVLLAPVFFLPVILLMIGVAWGLAALGLYFRDITHTTTVITTAMLFLSPILYPLSALPEKWRAVVYLNPLTVIVEAQRDLIFWGRMPDLQLVGLYIVVALIVAWAGWTVFRKSRHEFGDLL